MTESIESVPLEQLEATLLSDDFQWKLQQAENNLGLASFGVDRSPQKVSVEPELIAKFSEAGVNNLPGNLVTKVGEDSVKFGSRTKSHIRRLVRPERTIQENYFGLLCGYYGIGKDTQSQLSDVSQGQGVDTEFFWSLGPYIAQELRFYGVQPTQILDTIAKWGNGAKRDKHLPGTSKYTGLQAFHSVGFILTTDKDDHSHQFAQGLARILCSKLGVFKDVISEQSPMRIRDTSNKLIIVDEK